MEGKGGDLDTRKPAQLAPPTAKHLPNILSAARIPLSLLLLALKPFSAPFTAVYLTCGITDALDGWLARKLRAESDFGARLDSAADLTFFVAAFYAFVSAFKIPAVILIWASAIIVMRIAGLFIAFRKFGTWAALHTNAFRTTGFLFFCFPLFAWALDTLTAGVILCGLAMLATGEEIYINVRSPELDPDISGAPELRRRLTGDRHRLR